jgi:DNA-binding transcriptional ArsR family regulator
MEEGVAGTSTEFSRLLPISRQAISNHLAELVGAGLITGSRRGREVRYDLIPGGLGPAARWLEQRAASWDQHLQALARHLEADEH